MSSFTRTGCPSTISSCSVFEDCLRDPDPVPSGNNSEKSMNSPDRIFSVSLRESDDVGKLLVIAVAVAEAKDGCSWGAGDIVEPAVAVGGEHVLCADWAAVKSVGRVSAITDTIVERSTSWSTPVGVLSSLSRSGSAAVLAVVFASIRRDTRSALRPVASRPRAVSSDRSRMTVMPRIASVVREAISNRTSLRASKKFANSFPPQAKKILRRSNSTSKEAWRPYLFGRHGSGALRHACQRAMSRARKARAE